MSGYSSTFTTPEEQEKKDSFNRLRTSNPHTLFDSKQLFTSQSLLWTCKINSGSLFYSKNRASTKLVVSGTSGSYVVRQTKSRINYQPGKSILFFSSFIMNEPVVGLEQRIGLFDDYNGIFFLKSGSCYYMGMRSNSSGMVVDSLVSQSYWNNWMVLMNLIE